MVTYFGLPVRCTLMIRTPTKPTIVYIALLPFITTVEYRQIERGFPLMDLRSSLIAAEMPVSPFSSRVPSGPSCRVPPSQARSLALTPNLICRDRSEVLLLGLPISTVPKFPAAPLSSGNILNSRIPSEPGTMLPFEYVQLSAPLPASSASHAVCLIANGSTPAFPDSEVTWKPTIELGMTAAAFPTTEAPFEPQIREKNAVTNPLRAAVF